MTSARIAAISGTMPINTIRFIGLENKAARDLSFCKDNDRTMQSPKNVKPIEMNALLHEKLRTPCATIFSHSCWRGLSCPRLLIFKSSSVNSNTAIDLFFFHPYIGKQSSQYLVRAKHNLRPNQCIVEFVQQTKTTG